MITNRYNYAKIDRETVDGKRHYCLPDGSKVPSVTTILDKTKSEEKRRALLEWRKAVGEAKAQEITTEAAGRGTRMHKWLENYVKDDNIGTPGTNPHSIESHKMASTIVAEGLSKNVNEYWGVEVPLYYSGLYAGTTDCIAVWNENPAILDYKQSNKIKKLEWIEDYLIQLAAYSLAHNNMFDTNIRTGVILMCVRPKTNESAPVYQEFVLEPKDFDYWENIWINRVEQYYKGI